MKISSQFHQMDETVQSIVLHCMVVEIVWRFNYMIDFTACWCSSTPRSIGLTGTCRGVTQSVASGTSVGSCPI